jgi:hypothetical protein
MTTKQELKSIIYDTQKELAQIKRKEYLFANKEKNLCPKKDSTPNQF